MNNDFRANIGELQPQVDRVLKEIVEQNVVNRINEHDHTVWKNDPAEITNRLGWLHSPEVMAAAIPEISEFVTEIRSAGFTHALLLGMGGSSLAPEVFRLTFGVKEGFLDLGVLDSTHPGAVLEMAQKFNPKTTLFIVSTKSGGTVETISFMKYFYNKTIDAVGKEVAGNHFAAITDPGSGLEAMAKALNFRKIFLNDPDIGGRYSALSYFGLVPAALIGVDITTLLERATAMAANFKSADPANGENSSAQLGVTLGEAALQGRDKITLLSSPQFASFGAWVEQLIAESTGKEGKGILPVDGETSLVPAAFADDRLIVYLKLHGDSTYDKTVQNLTGSGFPTIQLTLNDLYDLGGEFFRWEIATIIASRALQINPFDQPDVESAKIQARKMMAAYQDEGKLPELTPSLTSGGITVFSDFSPENLETALKTFLAKANPGENEINGRSYVALQAYIKPSKDADAALQALCTSIQEKYRMAVTIGYGPRFLHSTGQLHKGDAGHGLFLQFTTDVTEDVAIPDEAGKDGTSVTFGTLINTQALGDRQALLDKGRNVIRFHLGSDVLNGLKRLAELV